ncbi:MAG TPA: hypothetical protein VFO34_15625, partial [Candidatus Acidoferrales bacterium]|nr:hypothetical protein [Candidatus Acidoferrales bacterium]
DIFHGAMVYSLLKNWPVPKMLDFCCAASALNCTALGARGGIRPIAEIERLATAGERHTSLFRSRKFTAKAAGRGAPELQVKLEAREGTG